MNRRSRSDTSSSKGLAAEGDDGAACEGSDLPALRKPAAGLHIVATPIGNLADLTPRARQTLAGVDLIACEDTRVTRKLMGAYGLTTPLVAYHDHNAARMRPRLIERLKEGKSVALVTDAGTPLIADPGFKLVRAALDAGLPVGALPGPSAGLTALVLSGLPSDRFLFAGFLPTKQSARRAALADWRDLRASLVFFESPRRLASSLADMRRELGDRPAAVARELTKRFEEVRRGMLSELSDHYHSQGAPKGEVVVVVGPAQAAPAALDEAEVDALLRAALTRAGTRDAAAEIAAQTGLPRRQLYRRALALRGAPGGGGGRS
jgi:16S rRNA (cytidine1402-2'-O)-methyltransferase